CSGQSQSPTRSTQAADVKGVYAVDGLTLGSNAKFGLPDYREYQCRPSDQFIGFTWCQRERQATERRGAYRSTNTILHTDEGIAVYINRSVRPAFWGTNEAQHDIDAVERKYREKPRIIKMPERAGLATGVIAMWGQAQLEPLDAESLSVAASGASPRRGL